MKPINEQKNMILEFIHQTRRELLAKHGGIAGLADFLRSQEAKSDKIFVDPDPVKKATNARRRTGD